MRDSEFGSPFKNTDSGIVTSNDHENTHKLKQCITNFLKEEEKSN